MAAKTLLHLPGFPQLFSNLIAHEINRVNRALGSCCYVNEYASCRERATVTDLETGCSYCEMHFNEGGNERG